jgi:hypothetical protein
VNSMIFSFDYHLGIYKSMSTINTQISRPKLNSFNIMRIVYNELILFLIKCCSCEQGSNIGSMTHLSLWIASYYFIGFTFLKILFMLFISSHYLNALSKHTDVSCAWTLIHTIKCKIYTINIIVFSFRYLNNLR